MITERELSKIETGLFSDTENPIVSASYDAVSEYHRAKRNALDEIAKMRKYLDEIEEQLKADRDVYKANWIAQTTGEISAALTKFNILRPMVSAISDFIAAKL